MRPRRLKVEFYDTEGVRHTITIDGPVTKEKAGKLLDLVELMSGTPPVSSASLAFSSKKFDRLTSIIISQLQGHTFNSSEAKRMFEKSSKETMPLSTVSTYLTRLVDRGILERHNEGPRLSYIVRREALKPSLVSDSSIQSL